MIVGVGALVISLLKEIGGPITGIQALAALPPTEAANNGFLSLSSGPAGLNIIFLAIVTSVGIWAQPQMIQRHFALKKRTGNKKAAPVMLALLSWLAGHILRAPCHSFSPGITNPDIVLPTLVHRLLPTFDSIFRACYSLGIPLNCLCTPPYRKRQPGQGCIQKHLTGWSWRCRHHLHCLQRTLRTEKLLDNSSDLRHS